MPKRSRPLESVKPKRPRFVKVTFLIATTEEKDRIEVTGYADLTIPELAIHKDGPDPWRKWELSHVATGLLLANRNKRSEIEDVLDKVKSLTAKRKIPWSSSIEEINFFFHWKAKIRQELADICRRPGSYLNA